MIIVTLNHVASSPGLKKCRVTLVSHIFYSENEILLSLIHSAVRSHTLHHPSLSLQ